MEERKDIFDWLMILPGLSTFQPIYKKYKEPLLYLFFGGMTTLLSILLFWVVTKSLKTPALPGNVIVWLICVAFAYFTNRTWVFSKKAEGGPAVAKECYLFVAGRFGTLLMEEVVLWIGIDWLGVNDIFTKSVAQILVIIGNYLISKRIVFQNDRAKRGK